HETLRLLASCGLRLQPPRPNLPRRSAIVKIDAIETLILQRKDDVGVPHLIWPAALFEMPQLPGVQKSQDGNETRVISTCEPFVMQLDEFLMLQRDTLEVGLLALLTPFLNIDDTEDVSGVVPQEAWSDTKRALCWLRHG